MTKQKTLVSIVVPVKDEQKNIEKYIFETETKLKVPYEILIVYDSDKDKTLPVARKIARKKKNIKAIKNTYGRGVVNATIFGFDKSKGDYLVMMAADLTDDPETINLMYKKLQEGYDVICPTRYSKGGKTNAPPSIKSLLSTLAGISTPFILGIPTSDLTYSYKMFRKKILSDIEIESKGGFEFAEELLIKSFLKDYKITEVPTLWIDRTAGSSKFKLAAWLPRYVYWYLYGFLLRIFLRKI